MKHITYDLYYRILSVPPKYITRSIRKAFDISLKDFNERFESLEHERECELDDKGDYYPLYPVDLEEGCYN